MSLTTGQKAGWGLADMGIVVFVIVKPSVAIRKNIVTQMRLALVPKPSGTANNPIMATAKITAPNSIQGARLPRRETVLSLK